MSTLTMITAFCYVLFFCFAIYAIRYYIDFLQITKAKNDIALLNAKILALRMALRVRVKIKLSSFRDRFSKYIDSGDEIDQALTEISAAKYETGSDFEKYFDLSKHIITTMKNDVRFTANFKELAEKNSTSENYSAQLFNEFCGPDYKNEIALVRVIKEITDNNNKVNKKILAFNYENRERKKFIPMKVVPLIDFPMLAGINEIFKDSDILLKELQKKKSDFFSDAA